MRNCEGLGNQGWGLYVSCLEGCVSVKWVEREGRMGGGRGGPPTLRWKRMVLVLRRKSTRDGAREGRGPRSPGGAVCPSPAHPPRPSPQTPRPP